MTAALLSGVVLATAAFLFHASSTVRIARASGQHIAARPSISTPSLPLFFEPNQGQTDARVKFLARGAGYGLFLTADEAVLNLQQRADKDHTPTNSVIRMHLDGANSAARIHGSEPLPGKSSYFIGNKPSKWQQGVSQFARVEYQRIYPGIDLVYYGNQRQLEYDFHVAPGADANQIALSFQGASAHLDSGDLVLATSTGDIRFHAPRVYQRGTDSDTPVSGSFRQLADNKVGFALGAYDHSRELVIDPLLTYSTYLGGTGTESLVKVAVDSSNNIYVAGSTTSADFPLPPPPAPSPIQSGLGGPGAQNIFIAVLNPSLPQAQQLLYATYLGGSGIDSLAGVAVSSSVDQGTSGFDVYVAGSTTSSDFPTAGILPPFQTGPQVGSHSFVSRINLGNNQLRYSTYLAGNGIDTVTGLAVDGRQDAYVTGTTTSTDSLTGFPSSPNAFQPCPFQPGGPCVVTTGPTQFFASKINTAGTGAQSMLYSTFYGGANPAGATAIGGGISVDPIANSSNVNMYFTGSTNMLGVAGPNGEAKFPLFNAFQSCLDESAKTVCTLTNPTETDAFVVKINPNQPTSPPAYATYLGGSQDDFGNAIAVDTSSNAYVTGATSSPDWLCASPCVGGPYAYGGGGDAFVAKVGNQTQTGAVFPLIFFTYLGGSAADTGQAIVVDAVGSAHLAGSTSSVDLPISQDALQTTAGGGGDAFAALIATSTLTTGNYVTYLGGNQLDKGTGVALDLNNATYVAGTTISSNFPVNSTLPPFQNHLNGSQPDAFVTKIGANSVIVVSAADSSPQPNPVPAGTPATFTFDLDNTGTDPATNVTFFATVPNSGIVSNPTAKVTSGNGTCSAVQGTTIVCNIANLAVNAVGTVEVDVTPAIPVVSSQIQVSGTASANGGPVGNTVGQQDSVVDFSISASPSNLTINAGDTASFPLTLSPNPPPYNATITMSETTSPSIVTSTTPTFTNPTVTITGSTSGTTTLNIATVSRPVNTGSLLRRSSFYATWLPIGGLSLVGLGVGAGRKRRRWVIGALLGLFAGIILLQPACSSGSNPVTTTGGTAAGRYTITVVGSAGTGAAHNTQVILNVN